MPEFLNPHLQTVDPEDDVTDLCKTDPALQRNMAANGLIWWFMGRWLLTRKGKAARAERKHAAGLARRQGVTNFEERKQ